MVASLWLCPSSCFPVLAPPCLSPSLLLYAFPSIPALLCLLSNDFSRVGPWCFLRVAYFLMLHPPPVLLSLLAAVCLTPHACLSMSVLLCLRFYAFSGAVSCCFLRDVYFLMLHPPPVLVSPYLCFCSCASMLAPQLALKCLFSCCSVPLPPCRFLCDSYSLMLILWC